jgi:hypothetical protein
MHELGHTLGLLHGGTDDINNKPNYNSVMNYIWQWPELPATPWTLDYSRRPFNNLNEMDLDEPVGIAGTPGITTSMWDSGTSLWVGVPENGPVDWNQDLDSVDTGVVADVNGDGDFTWLMGAEDWSRLRYYFRETAGGAGMDGDERGLPASGSEVDRTHDVVDKVVTSVARASATPLAKVERYIDGPSTVTSARAFIRIVVQPAQVSWHREQANRIYREVATAPIAFAGLAPGVYCGSTAVGESWPEEAGSAVGGGARYSSVSRLEWSEGHRRTVGPADTKEVSTEVMAPLERAMRLIAIESAGLELQPTVELGRLAENEHALVFFRLFIGAAGLLIVRGTADPETVAPKYSETERTGRARSV